MTQAEAMAFASKHINLIGRQVEFAGTRCSVLRFFVVDKGIDDYKVEMLLSPQDGIETTALLDRFLTDHELVLPIIVG